MRKNIVFVIHSPFPYYAGGIETWLYNLSSRLCESNNVIIVSEEKTFYSKPFFQLDSRIRVVHYKSLRKYSFFRKILRGPLQIIDNYSIIGNIKRTLSRLVDDNQTYYVIVLNTLFAATAVNRVRKRKDNVRFICSARGPHAEVVSKKYPIFGNYFHKIEKNNLIEADVALSNGYDTVDYFKKQGIKTQLMKNGIDVKRFNTLSPRPSSDEMPPECFNIVSVATLLDIKGIGEMITTLSKLVRMGHKNVRLILVGKGGKEKYEQQAMKSGVKEKVFFLGHRSNVIPYLQHADAICCLSGGGGLSMSALESMASGSVVVAWDTPVYRQLNKEEKTMILVEEKNTGLLAEAISKIILYPADCKTLKVKAIEEAKKYDWEIVMSNFIHHINQIK